MLSVCVYLIYGVNETFIIYLSLTYLLIAITFVDIDHFIIPNGFVLSGLALLLLGLYLGWIPIAWEDALSGSFVFAGFLFGFDTIVISGVDQKLQELWSSSDLFHGLVVVGMALWGTVIGAIFGGLPTNYFGRRKTLLWIGYLYSISAIGSAVCYDPITFAFFRFLGGVGIGISTIAAPAYISEISSSKKYKNPNNWYRCISLLRWSSFSNR